VLRSVFAEDRIQEEFSQELEETTDLATTLNPVAGGLVSTTVGAAAPTAAQVNIETSDSLQDPEIDVRVSEVTIPGDALLAEELGSGQVSGETGAVVDGYGAALGRISQELIRLMREQRVHGGWLFDESFSMKDDREEIRDKFEQVYHDLGLAQEKDVNLKRGKEILLTTIASYGQKTKMLTATPTNDIDKIRKAITDVPIDESGKEHMCQSIQQAVRRFRLAAQKQKRKLVIVVVSDESGDDGQFVDQAIIECKQARASVYVLGRESVFGYPYARQRWKDPKYQLTHWIRINRGPETAFPECLQWDGLRNRRDVYNSGFGPYEMVRLAKETNGIFFVLPGEEEDLSGPGAHDRRKFDFLAMKQYQPFLLPRKLYVASRNRSEFRRTLFDVIVTLNPNKNDQLPGHDPELNIREWNYSIDPAEFRKQAQRQVLRAARAMTFINQALPLLERIKPLRDQEPSQRWRAHYDLIFAQLLSYRVRLFQYLLAMDVHANTAPQPQAQKHNEWNVHRTKQMLVPDDEQFQRIKQAFKVSVTQEEYLEHLDEQRQLAEKLYDAVHQAHPGTPWSRRATTELRVGFGMKFVSRFRDPRYNRSDIKLPNF
ncbi:MAG: vWA domain-containing protein, partial [Planctomycetaceae bacterium]